MKLRPGQKLHSALCDAQVVVVRAPDADVDLGCGGAPLLEDFFPGSTVKDALGRSVPFRVAAEQAAMSRLYGGIHYRSDNEEGLVCGRRVAAYVLERASRDA